MPDRHYIARHEPPSRIDRFASHYGVVFMAALQIAAALFTAVGPILAPEFTPALSGDGHQFVIFRIVISVLVIVGGGLIIAGVLCTAKTVKPAWLRLKGGFTLGIGAWFAYTVSVLMVNPSAFIAVSSGVAHFLFCVTGLAITRSTELSTRRNTRRMELLGGCRD